MPVVLHVDDMYRHDPNDFPSLRRLLNRKGLELKGVAEFDDAASEYHRTRYPEVVIMDIMDERPDGQIDYRGVTTAERIEDSNQSSPQTPCTIYYTGVARNDPSVKRILDRDPYAIIVFKSDDAGLDAEQIYNHFPIALREHAMAQKRV